jgi:valyl-tRNA synthetase
MNKHLDNYEYGLAKIAFEEFFRADFCDNYLELVKVRLYKPELFEDGERKKRSGQKTLHEALYTIIQLIAPYLPHITEEIYQAYFKGEEHSIHTTPYPTVSRNDGLPRPNSEAVITSAMQTTLEIVELVRKYKSESQISMGTELSKLIISANPEQQTSIQLFEDDVKGITKAKKIERKEGRLGVECVI